MKEIATVAEARMARKRSSAGMQGRDASALGIRVTLQLAGRVDRVENGLAGRLVAWLGAVSASAAPHAIEALIHLDGAAGRPRLGESTCPVPIPLEVLKRLRSALIDAWESARNVDLLDEQGRPLLLGALHPHPAGVSRWLSQSLRDGRQQGSGVDCAHACRRPILSVTPRPACLLLGAPGRAPCERRSLRPSGFGKPWNTTAAACRSRRWLAG